MHDYDGARIACALLGSGGGLADIAENRANGGGSTPQSLTATAFKKYDGYTGDLEVGHAPR